ncbi:MAG: hypothetical protein ACRBN8_43335 [Nannocystales bacterium]
MGHEADACLAACDDVDCSRWCLGEACVEALQPLLACDRKASQVGREASSDWNTQQAATSKAFAHECGDLCREAVDQPVGLCALDKLTHFDYYEDALLPSQHDAEGLGGAAFSEQLYVAGLAPAGDMEEHEGMRGLLVLESTMLTTSQCLDNPNEVVEAVLHLEMNKDGTIERVTHPSGQEGLVSTVVERAASESVARCFAQLLKSELKLPRTVVRTRSSFDIRVRAPHLLEDLSSPGRLPRGRFL